MIEPSLLATTGVALFVAAAFRRREMLELRWQPDRHTWAALGAGLLPALLSSLALLLSQDSFAYEALLWLGIFGLCGFVVPWGYVLFVERASPAALGVARRGWATSLLLSACFAAGAALDTLQKADLSAHSTSHLLGAVAFLNVGGLFEAFLYLGFVHLRFRDAFGPLPAILGSAAIYSLWHIGTELPLHADPLAALLMLFVVGVLCHALFATTYNLLVVWPLFFTAGVMRDFIVNLGLPDSIGTSLGWPLIGWLLALGVPVGMWRVSRRRIA